MAPDNPLSTAEIDKLCAILALLTSDKAGEAAAAGAAATRFLAARGLTWRDLLVPVLPKPEYPSHNSTCSMIGRAIGASLLRPAGRGRNGLSDWDRRFLETIAGYSHRPVTGNSTSS